VIDIIRTQGWSLRYGKGRGYADMKNQMNEDRLMAADAKAATELFYSETNAKEIVDTKKLFSWLTGVDRIIVVLQCLFGFTNHEIAIVVGLEKEIVVRRFHELKKRAAKLKKVP
jgi:CRP-like cAMP-binding protein